MGGRLERAWNTQLFPGSLGSSGGRARVGLDYAVVVPGSVRLYGGEAREG